MRDRVTDQRATPRPAAAESGGDTGPMPWALVAALTFAAVCAAIQQTAVVPLLPVLQQHLDSSLSAVTWAFTVSLLCGAVATPMVGRLGELYGIRRTAMTVLTLLAAGAVLAAATTSLPLLIAGRVLQGFSVAVIPAAIGIVRMNVPPQRLATAVGVLSATVGMGGGIGMLLTGGLSEAVGDYHSVFWAIAVLAVLAAIAVRLTVPAAAPTGTGRPDLVGGLLLTGALVALLVAISQGRAWGWTSGPVLGLLAAAVVLAVLWVYAEQRVPTPLVAISMLTHRASIGANVASLLLGFAMFANITLISAYVQAPEATGGFAASVLDVGVFLLPLTVLVVAVTPYAGRMAKVTGPGKVVALGGLITALSDLWLILVHDEPYAIYVGTAVLGIGIGLGYAAVGAMAIEHVAPEKAAAASGVNLLVRVVGGAVSGAAIAAVLAAHTTAGQVAEAGFRTGWTVAGATGVVAAVFAVLYSGRRPAADQ
ncbi:MFS transporter [Streptomyces luteolus]|uniref:MFS transporter n=1 Tax=Streptomyces luteolus TaxID=3043615 RepID=A0ABT6T2I8_9ACTN|nr:MFS transporter [Streptomyces sp. B-S-A12]MDI3422092.1 MFS transporter [Streptomyces sp. B-S-A12]